MTQTPLPFGHRLHAPSACYGSGPPYAYGSCGAPPDQAYSGTGSHHHATGTGPAAQSSRPTDFQRLPTQFHLCVAPPRPGFDKHGNALAGFNGRQGADAGYGYQRADGQFHLCVAPLRPGFDKHGNALAGYNGRQGADAGYSYHHGAGQELITSPPRPGFDIHGYALAGYKNFADDRQRANADRQRADAERQRAAAYDRQRADDDRQRADAEHQRTIAAEQ